MKPFPGWYLHNPRAPVPRGKIFSSSDLRRYLVVLVTDALLQGDNNNVYKIFEQLVAQNDKLILIADLAMSQNLILAFVARYDSPPPTFTFKIV